MKFKLRWLLLILPLALLVWAWQAASWRPKLVGAQPVTVQSSVSNNPAASQLLVSPDGKRLVSSWETNRDFCIAAWNANSRQQEWKLSDEFSFPIAFSPDSRFLAIGYRKGTYEHPYTAVVLLDAATGKQRGPQMLPYHYIRDLQSAVFLSNRELVISTSQGAAVVDTQTGKAIRQWKFEWEFKKTQLAGEDFRFSSQSHVSADGTTVIALAISNDTTVAVYDAHTGKRRANWIYKGRFRNPRLSPDGSLWTLEEEKIDHNGVYDARTGQQLWGGFGGNPTNALWAWSADSRLLMLPKRGGYSIFKARERNFVRFIRTGKWGVALALDPRGDCFYTLDNAGKIYRWRAR